MMQWIKGFYVETCFFIKKNQNRQQNKLANMINGNDLIKHNYWPYLYSTYMFTEPRCVFAEN